MVKEKHPKDPSAYITLLTISRYESNNSLQNKTFTSCIRKH